MRFLAFGAFAIAAIVVSSSPAVAQASGASITVYNAQHASLTKAWIAGFTQATGIKVIERDSEDDEFGNQLVQEGAKSPADVFLTENSPAMVLVDNAKLLAPLPSDILSQVPEGSRPSSGRWVPIAARSTVFAYNKAKLTSDQLPKSLLDLAQPQWKGRWAAAPAPEQAHSLSHSKAPDPSVQRQLRHSVPAPAAAADAASSPVLGRHSQTPRPRPAA